MIEEFDPDIGIKEFDDEEVSKLANIIASVTDGAPFQAIIESLLFHITMLSGLKITDHIKRKEFSLFVSDRLKKWIDASCCEEGAKFINEIKRRIS